MAKDTYDLAKEANRNRLGVVVENDATRNALCDGLIEEFEEEEEEKGGQESAKKRKRNFVFCCRDECGRNGDDGVVAVSSGKVKSSLGNSGDKESDEEVKTISARLVVGADGPNGATNDLLRSGLLGTIITRKQCAVRSSSTDQRKRRSSAF